MNIVGEELFPLAKFLVVNQMRKFGITLEDLLILDEPDKPAAGFYDDEDKIICLNVGVIENYLPRFGLEKFSETYDDGMIEKQLTRCAAAVLFEECYHAANHGTENNTESLAVEYAINQVNKLPDDILSFGAEKEPETRITTDLESGGMVEFINEISQRGEMDETVETKYGVLHVYNDKNITKVKHTTSIDKLNEIKKMLGNVTNAGIAYAGLVYAFENNEWKTYIDTTSETMAETDIFKPVEVVFAKHEEIPTVKATINN